MRQTRRRSGFTLLELTISAAVLVVMAKFTVELLQGLSATTAVSVTKTRIQQSGEGALLSIIADLNSSGVVTDPGGRAFPYLDYIDGVVGDAAYDSHDHPAATHHAIDGEPDAGITREIVFLRPADANGDEIPDTDPVSGVLSWGVDEFSYVLVTNAGGRNVLERRVNAGAGVPVAWDVERVAFEDSAVSGENLPTDSIRVRIWYRAPDDEGTLQRYMAEATVRLRNG